MTAEVYIAGSRTATDWNAFRKTLAPGDRPHLWKKAFDCYFHERLSLRYLEPIRTLQENGTFQGEGFSIVTIQCTLIEFLESTVQGISYRYRRRGDPPLGPHEYSDSGDLFSSFLTKRKPFSEGFDKESARDFYGNVRCGLLHEARTKKGWTIWAKSPNGTVIAKKERIVYRDDFQTALLKFVEWYQGALPLDSSLQEAFLRKFDSLCE
jgi:hypothetical protein